MCAGLAPALAAAADWIPPVDLASPSESSPWDPRPEIAISGAGGGVAVWPQLEGWPRVEAASMGPTGIWGPPIRLATTFREPEPGVAMNEAGEAIVGWTQPGSSQSNVVASVRTPSGEWESPETLSPEGSVYGEIGVAVGVGGEALAAWSVVPRFTSASGSRIEGAFRPGGGQWQPPVTISKVGRDYASYRPQAAISPNGRVVVAWEGLDDDGWTVQVAEKQGDTWSSPQAVSTERRASFPKVEISNAGAAVVWQGSEEVEGGEGGWIEAASRKDGDWSGPVELSGPESFGPQVGTDSAGNAIATWSSFYGDGGDYVEGATLPVGGDWSAPTEIAGPVDLAEPNGARLAVAPTGQTLAAWSVSREPKPYAFERFVEAASGLEGEWEEPETLSSVGAWAVRPSVALDGEGDGAVAWWAADPTLPQATEFVAPRPIAMSSGSRPATSTKRSSSRAMRGRATVRRIAFVRKGKAHLHLHCPSRWRCKGDLRLIALRTAKHRKATRISAAGIHFTIPAHRERITAVRLNRKGRHLFSTTGKRGLRVRPYGHQIKRRVVLLRHPAHHTGRRSRTPHT